MIVAGLILGPPAEAGKVDAVSSGSLAAYGFAAMVLVLAWRHDPAALTVFALLALATVAIAWRTDAAVAAVPALAVLAVLVVIAWAVRPITEHLILPSGPTAGAIPEPAEAQTTFHLVLGALFALVFGGAGYLAQGRSERPLVPGSCGRRSGALTPVAVLVALNYRVAGWERAIPVAGLALLLAALFAVATEALARRTPRPGGCCRAGDLRHRRDQVGLAPARSRSRWRRAGSTVALALMVPGIAWIVNARPLPMLRTLAAIIASLVVARVGFEPRIVGNDLGAAPIFNWLLYGYGACRHSRSGPAATCCASAPMMRPHAPSMRPPSCSRCSPCFSRSATTLRTGGDIYAPPSGLAEVALEVSSALALAIGLEWLRGRTHSIVHNIGALVVAGIALTGIVFGLFIVENPVFTGSNVGGRVFNLILLGYGLPAVLAITLALIARTTRPMGYRAVAAVTSVVPALAFLSAGGGALLSGAAR